MSAIPASSQDIDGREQELAPVQLLLPNIAFPLTLRPARRLSDEELLEFCRVNEIARVERTAEGDLIVMTPVGNRGSNKENYIGREIDLWAEQVGKGIAFNANLGVSFPDGTMRMPDAAWLSSRAWEQLTEQQKDGLLPVCPEFIVELRSRTDRISDVEAKMEFWMSRGAQLGWLIDPQRRLAMVYRPGQEPETLQQPEFLEGEGPVAGLRLKMQRLWA
jgi:Uma2 family endonuclease